MDYLYQGHNGWSIRQSIKVAQRDSEGEDLTKRRTYCFLTTYNLLRSFREIWTP